MEDNNKNLTPLSVKIREFDEKGYTYQFKVENGRLYSISDNKVYSPEDVRVVEKFRFEGQSNPDDMSILYVLECRDGIKGTLVNAYGLYATEEIDQFVSEVPGEEPKI